MSMILTRSPLEPIGMNAAGASASTRRSARLSTEVQQGVHQQENEGTASTGGTRGKGAFATTTTTVGTKESNGGASGVAKKKRKAHEKEVDGFAFTTFKRSKATSTTTKESTASHIPSTRTPPVRRTNPAPASLDAPRQDSAPADKAESKTAQKKSRRRFPVTPEREAEKPIRRSKRLSHETVEQKGSPHKPAHAQSHANQEHSPSPNFARPVTVEKKRKPGVNGIEEEKTMRIQLPFQDTPVIRRNKEMRKTSAEGGSRRSSSGMRGRRASSLIDEGRGNAIPHAEVPSAEFYKHISADLTEPRRMRCLLGWCGTRVLPPRPKAPKDNTSASNLEFQAAQAARIIQEELSQDLVTRGSLSDWFSRDDSALPQVTLRKTLNPRNVANAAKAEELEKELERLKQQRAEWDELIESSAPNSSSQSGPESNEALSLLRPELLDSPQRRIVEQLQAPATSLQPPVNAVTIQSRLRNISENLEFTVDQFAHGVHALKTAKETGERLAERTLADSSDVLSEREKAIQADTKSVDPMSALRGLAKVLNGQQRGKS